MLSHEEVPNYVEVAQPDKAGRQWKHRMKVETVVILLEYNVSSIEVFLGGNQVDKYNGFLELLIDSVCSHDAYLTSF
nr:hypothetical protein Iba_chr01bCG12820 [Ipomoea batatas]GMC55713.1 hypothetical protein Iba_chr01fCG0310 [Ipomoea batatas]